MQLALLGVPGMSTPGKYTVIKLNNQQWCIILIHIFQYEFWPSLSVLEVFSIHKCISLSHTPSLHIWHLINILNITWFSNINELILHCHLLPGRQVITLHLTGPLYRCLLSGLTACSVQYVNVSLAPRTSMMSRLINSLLHTLIWYGSHWLSIHWRLVNDVWRPQRHLSYPLIFWGVCGVKARLTPPIPLRDWISILPIAGLAELSSD
jgi:hypothetical protein